MLSFWAKFDALFAPNGVEEPVVKAEPGTMYPETSTLEPLPMQHIAERPFLHHGSFRGISKRNNGDKAAILRGAEGLGDYRCIGLPVACHPAGADAMRPCGANQVLRGGAAVFQ